MKTCVYPGSFDPFTIGHLNIVSRAADIFDRVVILISPNSTKGTRFIPAETMKKAIEETIESYGSKCTVDILKSGTVLDYIEEHDLDYNIVRGIRDANDAVEEMRLVDQYKWFTYHPIEFIPFVAAYAHRSVSSSLVREMVKYGQLDKLPVPKPVYDLIVSKDI